MALLQITPWSRTCLNHQKMTTWHHAPLPLVLFWSRYLKNCGTQSFTTNLDGGFQAKTHGHARTNEEGWRRIWHKKPGTKKHQARKKHTQNTCLKWKAMLMKTWNIIEVGTGRHHWWREILTSGWSKVEDEGPHEEWRPSNLHKDQETISIHLLEP